MPDITFCRGTSLVALKVMLNYRWSVEEDGGCSISALEVLNIVKGQPGQLIRVIGDSPVVKERWRSFIVMALSWRIRWFVVEQTSEHANG